MKQYTMHGGPLAGESLFLSAPGTVVFTLHGYTGFYNRDNIWVAVSELL